MNRAWTLAASASVVLLVVGGCGGSAKVTGPPDVPGPGSIAGIYAERHSAGGASTAVGGVTVGLFRTAFVPGTLQYHPPQPIARSTTSKDGLFGFSGLAPGSYFVAPIDAKAVVFGQWVMLSNQRGASLLLVGCSDCPAPA